jgi:hypothetical protein
MTEELAGGNSNTDTARSWILAFVPVLALIGLFAWGFVAIETATRAEPEISADQTLEPLDPDSLVELGPPTDVDVPQPDLPDVEPIDQMPVREGASLDIYLKEGADDLPVVTDVAYLGTRDPYYAMGLLSADARVCLVLTTVDPESNPTLGGHVQCSSWEEFTQSELVIDMGGWEIRWSSDGVVQWIGI